MSPDILFSDSFPGIKELARVFVPDFLVVIGIIVVQSDANNLIDHF